MDTPLIHNGYDQLAALSFADYSWNYESIPFLLFWDTCFLPDRNDAESTTGCSNQKRFELELEFVQCLSSPQYLNCKLRMLPVVLWLAAGSAKLTPGIRHFNSITNSTHNLWLWNSCNFHLQGWHRTGSWRIQHFWITSNIYNTGQNPSIPTLLCK